MIPTLRASQVSGCSPRASFSASWAFLFTAQATSPPLWEDVSLWVVGGYCVTDVVSLDSFIVNCILVV